MPTGWDCTPHEPQIPSDPQGMCLQGTYWGGSRFSVLTGPRANALARVFKD